MSDKSLFDQANEHGWLFALAAGVVSTIAGLLTRKGTRETKAQRADRDRAEQNWDQAAQLRAEYKELLGKAIQREEELRRELFARDRDIDAKEHLIGNLKMREAARAVKWNTLLTELNERFPGEYAHLERWQEPNGTKEIKKP